ncbi:hypothetical protein P4O66_015073 [Electrophorus voltai]|uniref:Uncharacterized protein n=1 Tax=Electrophorus voltai TaxID=2609070 RepID=A0AAD8Z068_9TELE|nr:hypothetical protein P4O66_015073 [Electrophorus voltai]
MELLGNPSELGTERPSFGSDDGPGSGRALGEKAQQTTDIQNLRSAESENIQNLRSAESENIQNLRSTESENIQNLRSAESENIQNLRSAESENIQNLRSTESENIQNLRSAENENIQNLRSIESENIQNLRSIKSENIQNLRSIESENIQNLRSIKSENIQNLRSIEIKEGLNYAILWRLAWRRCSSRLEGGALLLFSSHASEGQQARRCCSLASDEGALFEELNNPAQHPDHGGAQAQSTHDFTKMPILRQSGHSSWERDSASKR